MIINPQRLPLKGHSVSVRNLYPQLQLLWSLSGANPTNGSVQTKVVTGRAHGDTSCNGYSSVIGILPLGSMGILKVEHKLCGER